METLKGLGVSDGIAIGRAVCLESRHGAVYRFPIPEAEIEEEIERFHRAIERAQREVRALGKRVGDELGADLGGIFEAHFLLLQDSHLHEGVEERIRSEHVNADWAVWETIEELRQRFREIDSEHLRDRGEDLEDVGRYLIQALHGVSHHELDEISDDVIIIADDLTPSEAVRLGRQGVVGFAIEVGGRTSHTAIIAHSLNIPLVTGLSGIVHMADSEDPVIVDGGSGRVVLHPTPAVLARHRTRRRDERAQAAELLATRELESVTSDGFPITLMANIDLSEEVDEAIAYGAAGIGLYRSEFLYIEKSPALPTEEEHYRLYRQLLERMAPHPVVIRTFDLGGRKLAREVLETAEDNPVLGLRGVRLTLARPGVFRPQLRAIFRAGCHGDLRVMVPLLSTLEELHQFRRLADEVMSELDEEGVPYCDTFDLGAMIEVPSAALIADHLAREVEFFSIGTNDLIQYALAADRNNEHVTHLYQPLHPGILRMIRSVVEAAAAAEIPVSVCGEMAADPLGALVLVGLGVRHLSVSPRRVPSVKSIIRQLDVSEISEPVRSCVGLASTEEVVEVLGEKLGDELAFVTGAEEVTSSSAAEERLDEVGQVAS